MKFRNEKHFVGLCLVVVTLCFAPHEGRAVAANQYKVLHNFVYANGDGYAPEATLVFDGKGNLYGTTVAGGIACEPPGCGIVFELSPESNGNWNENALHEFDRSDGSFPASPLTFDGSGNLYGSTAYGGSAGNGTVFELTPRTDGVWNAMECPAILVPVEMRQTGMRGAWHGTRKETYGGADCKFAAAD